MGGKDGREMTIPDYDRDITGTDFRPKRIRRRCANCQWAVWARSSDKDAMPQIMCYERNQAGWAACRSFDGKCEKWQKKNIEGGPNDVDESGDS